MVAPPKVAESWLGSHKVRLVAGKPRAKQGSRAREDVWWGCWGNGGCTGGQLDGRWWC